MFTFATEWHGSYSRSWLEGNPARKNLVSSHTLALGIRLEAGLDDLRAAAGSTTILRVPVHVAIHLAKTGVVGIVLHPEALLQEMVASEDGLDNLLNVATGCLTGVRIGLVVQRNPLSLESSHFALAHPSPQLFVQLALQHVPVPGHFLPVGM